MSLPEPVTAQEIASTTGLPLDIAEKLTGNPYDLEDEKPPEVEFLYCSCGCESIHRVLVHGPLGSMDLADIDTKVRQVYRQPFPQWFHEGAKVTYYDFGGSTEVKSISRETRTWVGLEPRGPVEYSLDDLSAWGPA